MITLLSTMNLRKLKILLLYYNNKASKKPKKRCACVVVVVWFAVRNSLRCGSNAFGHRLVASPVIHSFTTSFRSHFVDFGGAYLQHRNTLYFTP